MLFLRVLQRNVTSFLHPSWMIANTQAGSVSTSPIDSTSDIFVLNESPEDDDSAALHVCILALIARLHAELPHQEGTQFPDGVDRIRRVASTAWNVFRPVDKYFCFLLKKTSSRNKEPTIAALEQFINILIPGDFRDADSSSTVFNMLTLLEAVGFSDATIPACLSSDCHCTPVYYTTLLTIISE